MEQKAPSSTRPGSLGRLKLRRVAVPIKAKVAAEPEPTRTALIACDDAKATKAIAAHLKSRFSVVTFDDGDSAYDHYGANAVELVILKREMPGMAGTVLCELIRKSKKGGAVAVVLVSPRYADPYLGAGECTAFGADAFFRLPAQERWMEDRIEAALAHREPIERLDLLPAAIAQRIDELFWRFELMNYYELLEVGYDAEKNDLQVAFHERSLLLHPDRHSTLKDRAPHAWEKINTVYKRVSEAYKVLGDSAQRSGYNVGLQKRGALRYEPDKVSRRQERELAMCHTEEGRRAVLESLEMRALGDLEAGAESMAEALQSEPGNEDLERVLSTLNKLVNIMSRA